MCCARLWGYDLELEARVYKLLEEMENRQLLSGDKLRVAPNFSQELLSAGSD